MLRNERFVEGQPVHLNWGAHVGGTYNIHWDMLRQILLYGKRGLPDGSSITKLSLGPERRGYSVDNLKCVSVGALDFGFSKAFEVGSALRGEPPYDRKYDNIRSVLTHNCHGGVLQFCASKKLGITSVEEIAEKGIPLRLASYALETSSHQLTRMALEAVGLSYDELAKKGGRIKFTNDSESVFNDIRDGKWDAWSSSHPNPGGGYSVWRVTNEHNVRMLQISDKTVSRISEKYLGMHRHDIPKDTYAFMDEDVHSFRDTDMVVTREDMPEWLVYSVAKCICEARDMIRLMTFPTAVSHYFDPSLAWKDIGPLHKGAERYFREAGYLS